MKKIIFFCAIMISFLMNAQSKPQIDSLIIEASLDPGSGPDFNLIKIYFSKNKFVIEYKFYEGEDRKGYINDPERRKLREEYKDLEFKKTPRSYYDKLDEIRNRQTTFYTKKLTLKNKNYKDYLYELYKVSSLSQNDIEKEKNENNTYLHGVMFCSDFYRKNNRTRLCASALRKDNFRTIYNIITHTLDLYRKQNTGEKFNSKTFGY